jgi:hypothetical protein
MPSTPNRALRRYSALAAPTQTHLTTDELAERLRRTRKTVERNYAKWGLRPLRLGGGLIFPITQVVEMEDRAVRGEIRFG